MSTPVIDQPRTQCDLTLTLHPADPPATRLAGFSARPARVALCRGLAAGIAWPQAGGLTPCDVDKLQLSLHQAWNAAAANLIAAAETPEGIRFYTRPAAEHLPGAAGGLQVAAHGGRIGAWLAHPWPLGILNTHLTGLLGGEVVLTVVGADLLVATRAGAPEPRVLLAAPGDEPCGVFTVRRGFPVPWVSSRADG